jgi:hypothetical protein
MNYVVTDSLRIPDDEVSEMELTILEYLFIETMKEVGIMEETLEE